MANKEKKYELLRFWLIGSWIANQKKSNFFLINLVRSECEHDIESRFNRHIKHSQNRKFIRITWEEIYNYINVNSPESNAKSMILSYIEHKTLGYNRLGELQSAFALPIKL